MLLHVDTDLGGDADDVGALVMLLGWPGVELSAITTTIDPDGRRAGCAEHVLGMLGREVPVIAGAAMSSTIREPALPADEDPRHWPAGIRARPAPPGAALDALERSLGARATIAAIGPLTNLAALELLRPGALAQADVVVMGGWVDPPAAGLPPWGPEMDWKIGALLARQSQARAEDAGMPELGRRHPGLPDDLVNFHFDPVTCAIAAGWAGMRAEEVRLSTVVDEGLLRFVRDPVGRPARVVLEVDGAAFADTWLAAVETASRAAACTASSR